MAINQLFCIRGAVTLREDDEPEIFEKTVALTRALIEANGLDRGDKTVISCLVSSTKDITAAYPASAITRSGILAGVPLMSASEPDISGALPLCVRILMTVANCGETAQAKHVYLERAAMLNANTEKERIDV